MKAIKGQFKRTLAGVLAVMMLLSSPMTALAEEINAPADIAETAETEPIDKLSGIEDSTPSIAGEATPEEAGYETEEFSQSRTIDDVIITITAEPGVFPEGAKLEISKVTDKKDIKEIDAAVEEARGEDKNVAFSCKTDIKVYDKYGKEIQPDTEKGRVLKNLTGLN